MSSEPNAFQREPQTGPALPLLLYRAARKNWLLVTAIGGMVALGVALYTASLTKIYEARATIQFDPQPIQPLGKDVQAVVNMGQGSYWSNKEYYQTQYEILLSTKVAKETVSRLNLHRDGAFLKNLPPGTKASAADVPVDKAADVLRSRLTLSPIKDSRLASISLQDADPARAQRVLGVLVDTYVEQNLESGLSAANQAAEWLGNQLVKLKSELENNEHALHSYKKKKNMLSVSYGDQNNMLREEIAQINQALTQARVEREEFLARQKALDSMRWDDASEVPASKLLDSPLLAKLRDDFVAVVREKQGLIGAGKGEEHPEVKAVSARLESTRAALLHEVASERRSIEHALAAKNGQVAGLAGLFERAKAQALELNLLEIEYKQLERQATNAEKLYSFVLERAEERDLTRMMRFNNISVVDRPRRPSAPVKPNLPTNIAAGLVFGLLLGFGAAFGKESLDRSLKSPEEVERELGVAFLGLLPSVAEKSPKTSFYGRARNRSAAHPLPGSPPELIVHERPMSGIAEAARAIRTNILFMAPDRPHRLLLITSASPVEGKTTVACCIATAMAQAGQRVLLVDCDMRRPRLHRVFGKQPVDGLTKALLEPSLLPKVTLETVVPNLYLLPLGAIPPNPSELLHSDAFAKLLDTFTAQYDRVVIDSPPLAPVTDAAILSTKVDGTVVVVRAHQTRKDLARRAVSSIRSIGGRIIGCVLNAADLQRLDYGEYRYYYGAQSAYYTETPGEDSPPAATTDQNKQPDTSA